MTIQLFDDKQETLNFYNSFKGVSDYLASERQKMLDYCYYAYDLADMLYDVVPASRSMPIEIWRKGFNRIIQSMTVCGTYEQYLQMLHGLFNIDAAIEFTVTAPGELFIEVDTTEGQGLDPFIFSTSDNDTITDGLDDIIFVKILEKISSADLITLLKTTAPAGIKVTFSIT